MPPLQLKKHRASIDAVIFDMDGTLVNTEPIAMGILREALQQFQAELTHDDELQTVGKAWPAVLSELKKRKQLNFDTDDFFKQIVTLYNERINHDLPVLPGAINAVHIISNQVPIGLVSGSHRAQIIKILGKLNILSRFKAIFGIEDYLKSKPAPDGYLMCAEALNIKPQHCLVIEDSKPGVLSAKAAGMTVAVVTAANFTKQDVSMADRIYPTLNELLVDLGCGDPDTDKK